MKTITYEYDKMKRAGEILNLLPVTGVQYARLLAELGNILDAGQLGEVMEREEGQYGIHAEKVCKDKLEE